MNIMGVTALTEVEKATLKALGAVENQSSPMRNYAVSNTDYHQSSCRK
ncbi:MAG: hypothetical protein MUE44_29875 [Oscillatoriaceae cyanobacterium Prado104]|nr:hypothetical protein [Oscillatoriaceae cyanobacterium Prado104]